MIELFAISTTIAFMPSRPSSIISRMGTEGGRLSILLTSSGKIVGPLFSGNIVNQEHDEIVQHKPYCSSPQYTTVHVNSKYLC